MEFNLKVRLPVRDQTGLKIMKKTGEKMGLISVVSHSPLNKQAEFFVPFRGRSHTNRGEVGSIFKFDTGKIRTVACVEGTQPIQQNNVCVVCVQQQKGNSPRSEAPKIATYILPLLLIDKSTLSTSSTILWTLPTKEKSSSSEEVASAFPSIPSLRGLSCGFWPTKTNQKKCFWLAHKNSWWIWWSVRTFRLFYLAPYFQVDQNPFPYLDNIPKMVFTFFVCVSPPSFFFCHFFYSWL